MYHSRLRSIYLRIHLSVHPSINPPPLSVRPSIHPFIYSWNLLKGATCTGVYAIKSISKTKHSKMKRHQGGTNEEINADSWYGCSKNQFISIGYIIGIMPYIIPSNHTLADPSTHSLKHQPAHPSSQTLTDSLLVQTRPYQSLDAQKQQLQLDRDGAVAAHSSGIGVVVLQQKPNQSLFGGACLRMDRFQDRLSIAMGACMRKRRARWLRQI